MRTPPLLLALPLATVLLLVPLPVREAARHWPALLEELENAAHPFLFAALTWVLFRSLRRGLPRLGLLAYPATFVMSVGFGLATEATQAFTGRDASWIDVGNDVLGTLFALLLIARVEIRRSRPGNAVPRLLALLAAAVATFSMLPLGWTLAAYVHRAAASPVLWQPDSPLFNRFSHWQRGQFPGLVLQEPLSDWRSFTALEIDVRNASNERLEVTVRVHDLTHNQQYLDRFNQVFNFDPRASRTLRIPMERIRKGPETRQMDLAAIRGVAVFQEIANQPPRFTVQEIRLVR
jgi:VanZ family protein